MRKTGLTIAFALLLALVVAGTASATHNRGKFEADLVGANEVPPVATAAEGKVEFERAGRRGNRLRWELEAQDIENVVGGHIHRAPVGVNGPIIVDLNIPSSCVVEGDEVRCRGVVRRADLAPGLKFRGLLRLMRTGQTYVNVHTEQNPGGEIRGQLARSR